MASTETDTMTALQELLDERQRYEGWLAVLEGRRSSTPKHVYERVHTDYSLRLERVTERLSERAEQLAATISSTVSRLSAVRQREAERMDTRHEAELRAAVGEYGADEWERIRSTADGELDTIATERRTLESEVADLERIAGLATGSRATGSERSGATAAGDPLDANPVKDAGRSDEAGSQTSPDRAPSDRSADPGAATAESSDQESSFVPEWPAQQGTPVVPSAAPNTQSANATPGTQSPASAPRPVPPPTADMRRDAEKNLKCPECGVMNYPTEWYCERCGGELSTF